jgi:hypothetical protein
MSPEVTGVNVTSHALNPFSGYLLIIQTIMEKSISSYLPDRQTVSLEQYCKTSKTVAALHYWETTNVTTTTTTHLPSSYLEAF